MEISNAITALAALAQETRLDIFRLLVRAGTRGIAAGQIALTLDLAPATLSFHLNQLRGAGLIGMRRDGRSLIYSADYTAMNALLGYLTEECCQGAPDACAPDACAITLCDGASLTTPAGLITPNKGARA